MGYEQDMRARHGLLPCAAPPLRRSARGSATFRGRGFCARAALGGTMSTCPCDLWPVGRLLVGAHRSVLGESGAPRRCHPGLHGLCAVRTRQAAGAGDDNRTWLGTDRTPPAPPCVTAPSPPLWSLGAACSPTCWDVARSPCSRRGKRGDTDAEKMKHEAKAKVISRGISVCGGRQQGTRAYENIRTLN